MFWIPCPRNYSLLLGFFMWARKIQRLSNTRKFAAGGTTTVLLQSRRDLTPISPWSIISISYAFGSYVAMQYQSSSMFFLFSLVPDLMHLSQMGDSLIFPCWMMSWVLCAMGLEQWSQGLGFLIRPQWRGQDREGARPCLRIGVPRTIVTPVQVGDIQRA